MAQNKKKKWEKLGSMISQARKEKGLSLREVCKTGWCITRCNFTY